MRTISLLLKESDCRRTVVFVACGIHQDWTLLVVCSYVVMFGPIIPLLLSKSPHFACICLSHSLICVVSFVFRTSWHGNLLSLRLLGNRASFQIGPLLTGSSDRAHSFLCLAPSRLSIKCSVGPYPIPNFLSPHPPCSHYPSPNIFPSPAI